MTTICENSKQVILKYTSVIPHRIAYRGSEYHGAVNIGWDYWQEGNQYFLIQASLDAEITWDFTPDLTRSLYQHPITYTHANPNIDPPTSIYNAYFFGFYEVQGIVYDEEGIAYYSYIDNSDEENPINRTDKITTRPGYYNFIKYDSSDENASSFGVLDMSISKGEIYYFLGYAWTFNWYFDGEYRGSRTVRSNTNSPPQENVLFIEATPDQDITETFAFEEITEKVELIKSPTDSYSWSLKKTKSGIEEIIHTFAGIEPELLCFLNLDECPENSCQVDCGEHYCCYNSQGISIHAFLKSEGGN